jgi:hypothetical protein
MSVHPTPQFIEKLHPIFIPGDAGERYNLFAVGLTTSQALFKPSRLHNQTA